MLSGLRRHCRQKTQLHATSAVHCAQVGALPLQSISCTSLCDSLRLCDLGIGMPAPQAPRWHWESSVGFGEAERIRLRLKLADEEVPSVCSHFGSSSDAEVRIYFIHLVVEHDTCLGPPAQDPKSDDMRRPRIEKNGSLKSFRELLLEEASGDASPRRNMAEARDELCRRSKDWSDFDTTCRSLVCQTVSTLQEGLRRRRPPRHLGAVLPRPSRTADAVQKIGISCRLGATPRFLGGDRVRPGASR